LNWEVGTLAVMARNADDRADLDADGNVRRSRPARGERDDRAVGHAEERVGHVAGRLLVTRRDRPDGVGAIVERVEQPDVAVPAQAEDVWHLLAHQVLDDDLAAVAHGPSLSHRRLL
jgi:hypothetical protein